MTSSSRSRHGAGPFQEMAFMALDVEDGHELSGKRLYPRDPEHSQTDSGSVSELHSTQTAPLRLTTREACSPCSSSRQDERSHITALGLVTGRASSSSTPRGPAEWSRPGAPHPRAEEAHEPAPETESEPLLPSEPPSLLDEQPSAAVKGDGWRGEAERDDFYRMVYRYYCARGLWCMTMSVRATNCAGLLHPISVLQTCWVLRDQSPLVCRSHAVHPLLLFSHQLCMLYCFMPCALDDPVLLAHLSSTCPRSIPSHLISSS